MEYNKQKYWEIRSTTSSLHTTGCFVLTLKLPALKHLERSPTFPIRTWWPHKTAQVPVQNTSETSEGAQKFTHTPLHSLCLTFLMASLSETYMREVLQSRLLLPSTLWCTADTSKLPRGNSPRPTLFLSCMSSYASFIFTQLGSFTTKILDWDSGDINFAFSKFSKVTVV